MKNTISLNENRDFKRLYNRGTNIVAFNTVIYYSKNRYKINRLGITVSKKLGNAVARNRTRRLIKENYRLIEESVMTGYDIVIVARNRAHNADFYAIKKDMLKLFKNLHPSN